MLAPHICCELLRLFTVSYVHYLMRILGNMAVNEQNVHRVFIMTFLLPVHLPQTAQIHFWGRWVFSPHPNYSPFFPLCSFIKETSLVPRDAISDWSQPSASYAFLTSSSPGTSRAPSLINTADKLWMRFDYHDLEPRQDVQPLPTVHVALRNNLDAAKRSAGKGS